MADLIYVAVIVAFFAVAALFVVACDRIIGKDESDRDGPTRWRSRMSSTLEGGGFMRRLERHELRQRRRSHSRGPDRRVPRVRARCSRRSSDVWRPRGCNSSFCIVLLAISTPLLGIVPGEGVRRRQGARRPRLPARSSGSSTASAASTRRASSAGRRTRSRCSRSASSSLIVLYAQLRLQGHLPLNPDGLEGRAAGAVVQHRGELPHQHELAELLGRVDDVAPHPDGRASRCTTSCRPRPARRSRSR